MAARERSRVGAVRNLIEPGGNIVMPSREIVIAIVAPKDVCDWLIAQDLCSLPKTGTQPQVQSRGGARTLKEYSPHRPLAQRCIFTPRVFLVTSSGAHSRNSRIPHSPRFLLFVPLLASPKLPKIYLSRDQILSRLEGVGDYYHRLFRMNRDWKEFE